MTSARWTTEITGDLDAVLVFGGDGTLHRHLAQLSELKVPMLVVPSGSGNDFASGLGIHSLEDAMHAWHRFNDNDLTVRAIDLGVVHDAQPATHLFCNVANLGLDADINRRANRLPARIRGNGGYILSLFPALRRFRPTLVKLDWIAIDGTSHALEEAATLIAFANGTRYGHGLHIAPQASMADGYLDVCFVRNTSKLRIATLFPMAYFGRHLKLPEVKYFRCRSVRIETSTPADIYADGDYLCQTPVEIGIVEAGLRVIVPHV